MYCYLLFYCFSQVADAPFDIAVTAPTSCGLQDLVAISIAVRSHQSTLERVRVNVVVNDSFLLTGPTLTVLEVRFLLLFPFIIILYIWCFENSLCYSILYVFVFKYTNEYTLLSGSSAQPGQSGSLCDAHPLRRPGSAQYFPRLGQRD